MERYLLQENTKQINDFLSKLESFIPGWQKIVDECLILGISPDIMEINLNIKAMRQNNFSDNAECEYIEDYVRGKLADKVGQPEIGGIKLNRSKFMEIIDLPNCSNLIGAIRKIMYNHELGNIDMNLYTLLDNKVIIPPYSIESIKEMPQHRIYATTEKQMEARTHAQRIVDALKELSTLEVTVTCKSNLIMYEDTVPKVNCLTISNIQ